MAEKRELWWRQYVSILDPDDKSQTLTDRQFRHWQLILALYRKNDGVLPDCATIARAIRVPSSKVQTVLNDLVGVGLLDFTDGAYAPHNWDQRQFESDTSTGRVRAFRKRQEERRRNVSGNVSRNVSETASENREQSTEQVSSGRVSANTQPPSNPVALPSPAHTPAPPDTHRRIKALADTAPNQQDYRQGMQLAVQAVISAADPEDALAAMERNIPGWWEAMRAGRARLKPLRYVIVDGDWMREAPLVQSPKLSGWDAEAAKARAEYGV